MVKLNEHRGKIVIISPGHKVPLNLSSSDNASEKILYGKGQVHLSVGFDFRQIDDHITFHKPVVWRLKLDPRGELITQRRVQESPRLRIR